MTCEEARALLDGYCDRELELSASVEMERHLGGCQDCARKAHDLDRLRAAIRRDVPPFAAPPALARRISETLARESRPRWRSAWTFAAAASLLAALLVGGSVAVWTGRTAADSLADAALASHLRALMPGHLADVVSTNQHTVKPWFAGRLDYSPPVQDFAQQGYPLLGGRLDYLDGRPVAALVYGRRLHRIDLYAWPAEGRRDVELRTRRGYHLADWTESGMTYWAVSDLNAQELSEFVRLVRDER